MKRTAILSVQSLGLLLFLAFACGCDYEAPLTAKPTGKIDPQLLGNWIGQDTGSFPETNLKIRKLDDSNYLISYGGFYRAYHSDLGDIHFVSIQNIEPVPDKERKYILATYELKDNGDTLIVRTINDKVIPNTLKTSAELEKAIRANLKNPDLFKKDPGVFNRAKAIPQKGEQSSPAESQ